MYFGGDCTGAQRPVTFHRLALCRMLMLTPRLLMNMRVQQLFVHMENFAPRCSWFDRCKSDSPLNEMAANVHILVLSTAMRKQNSNNIKHIKNEEHTPQFHIWNNWIHLYLFCHFFSSLLCRLLQSCLFVNFFVRRYIFLLQFLLDISVSYNNLFKHVF